MLPHPLLTHGPPPTPLQVRDLLEAVMMLLLLGAVFAAAAFLVHAYCTGHLQVTQTEMNAQLDMRRVRGVSVLESLEALRRSTQSRKSRAMSQVSYRREEGGSPGLGPGSASPGLGRGPLGRDPKPSRPSARITAPDERSRQHRPPSRAGMAMSRLADLDQISEDAETADSYSSGRQAPPSPTPSPTRRLPSHGLGPSAWLRSRTSPAPLASLERSSPGRGPASSGLTARHGREPQTVHTQLVTSPTDHTYLSSCI